MRTLAIALVSALAAACGPGAPDADEGGATQAEAASQARFQDPDVARIHARMMEAMAPDGGWERARYLEFDWMVGRAEGEAVRRSHRWDRWEGDYRLQAPAQDGGEMVALFNVHRPAEGRVWVDGTLQEGSRADSLLRRAHAIHINDSYWLLMPYKWADPGVHATYLGERADEDGRRWEVVELSFDEGVGLTPQNMYRAWIDPGSGLMERWEHLRTPDADPSPAGWTDWRQVGPVRLAMDRPFPAGGRIHFENVRVGPQVPADAFAPPGG